MFARVMSTDGLSAVVRSEAAYRPRTNRTKEEGASHWACSAAVPFRALTENKEFRVPTTATPRKPRHAMEGSRLGAGPTRSREPQPTT